MYLDFSKVINDLGTDAAFEVASAQRDMSEYMLAAFLPEINKTSYHVEGASLTVRPTMAGLAAMDSPYSKAGVITASSFLERSAKVASQVSMREETLRELQEHLRVMGESGNVRGDFLALETLAFLEDVVIQGHMDTFEFLRGRALADGAIDWTFNGLSLTVDYGVPSANKLTKRTTASDTAYGGTDSKFWDDVRELQRILRYSVQAFITHPDTMDEILANSANGIRVMEQTESYFEIVRVVGSTERDSSDRRDVIRIYTYGAEGEIIDASDVTTTKMIPFFPRGKLVAIGRPGRRGYVVGQGSARDVMTNKALGYTHIAPTVEGGGRPGRWARLFVPQERPWELHAQAVTNGLPVIENPELIAIAETEFQA